MGRSSRSDDIATDAGAELTERRPLAGVDRADRGPADVCEDQATDAVDPCEMGDLQRRGMPPTPPAKRIGLVQPAASANMRSHPAAQRGNVQNSGAQTIRAVPSEIS